MADVNELPIFLNTQYRIAMLQSRINDLTSFDTWCYEYHICGSTIRFQVVWKHAVFNFEHDDKCLEVDPLFYVHPLKCV